MMFGAVMSLGAVSTKPSDANVFYYSLSDDFISNLADKMDQVSDDLGMNLARYDAGGDLGKQISQVQMRLAISDAPIVINPVDVKNGEAVLRNVKRKGSSVVFFNRMPSQEAFDAYANAYYVGSDSTTAGFYQAEILADYLYKHPSADKNGNGALDFIMLKGEAANDETIVRSEGFAKAMAAKGIKLNPLMEKSANWSYTYAIDALNSYLYRHDIGDVEAIVCNNDEMALGVIAKLREMGYNKGNPDKYIPVVGIDATERGIAAVKEGAMLGTVLNDASAVARVSLKIAKALNEGVPVTSEVAGYPVVNRKVAVPFSKVTASL